MLFPLWLYIRISSSDFLNYPINVWNTNYTPYQMHVALHTLSICQFLVVQAVYTSPITVRIMDLIRSWIMHSNHIISSYWLAVWSNSLIFFFSFFLSLFYVPQQQFAPKISRRWNFKQSLSLSPFWGPYSYLMCTFFFFFFGWMHYVYQWVKEEKISIQNRNYFLFFILYSSTISHRSQNNLFDSIV